MDAVFALSQAPRAHFLRSLIQSFACTYVSLWQHSLLSKYISLFIFRLFFLDGFYNALNNKPTSSQSLFHQYGALTFDVSDDLENAFTFSFFYHFRCVPGLAFKNQLPYIQLKLSDLLPITSTQIQAQFFQEAGIEMAVFMGCKEGEIELGFSNIPQADIETALKNLFPEDFYMRFQSIDQNPYSSSSSSFIISSTNTFNQSINVPGTSHSNFPDALGVGPTQPISHQPLSQVIPFPSHLPTPEGEHQEIVRALIRVLSSTSQQELSHQVLPHNSVKHPGAADVVRYIPDSNINPHMESNFSRRNLQNTSFPLLKNLNSKRMRERHTIKPTHPISSQKYYHTVSERKRREKLSECFQELSALLPLGTKTNKRWVLTAAKETMRSLMVEIEELKMRNEQLMRVLSGKEVGSSREEDRGRSYNERLNIRVLHASESSSSEEQMVNLEVTVREQSSEVNVLVRILEFLERVQNVTLISTNTNLHITEGGTAINVLTFRLRIIEGSEWDEVGFEEAVRRVVADITHREFYP
ncbi:putative transcription factor bHLH041 [Vigna umbellata]|uniref:putative transcription factor bHLH041 n=1 Tax=Vigna umbellata TaxID=87088 RepID=UPI001F5F54AC|nr:putative transcription factor bHLH041 [Vigna umbellata]